MEKRHEVEFQTAKEEMEVLLQQRDALQKQVTEAAVDTPLIKQVVSPLFAFSSQSRRLMGQSLCLHWPMVSISAGLKETGWSGESQLLPSTDGLVHLPVPAIVKMDFCWPVTSGLVF